MSGSLEAFSRQIHNVLRAQQSQILQALNVQAYEIHQKLSTIQGDVESLRNETLSQQNAFRSAFDIVAARLDEIQQISQTTRPNPPVTPAPNKGTNEDHRILQDTINNRIELAEKRLGKSMGDVAKKVQAVEQGVAKIFETVTVKDPPAAFNPITPDSAQASLAELQKMIERLSQGSFVPPQPVTQPADLTLPTPTQSDKHRTPPNGTKTPEAVSIEPARCTKPSKSPPKPSQAREQKTPKAPVANVRWSSRLEKMGKSDIDALFSADSPLTEPGSPQKRSPSPSLNPSKTGKELVLHSSNAPNKSLGKRKRNSGVPRSRKKAATASNTTSKGEEIVRYDESDQLPVMVLCNKCNGWYHIKCVSIDENDPCMTREDVPYTCPPCNFPDRYTAIPREGGYNCGAPGCVIPRQESGDEVYYIDRLIGRKPIDDQNTSTQFAWLVKFDGYPVAACLWKPEDTFDATALKVEFYAAATKEGTLSSAEDHEVLLLREAADHGGHWDDDRA